MSRLLEIATTQSDAEEQLKPRDGCVECDRRGAAIDQVQLKVMQIFDSRGIRRTSQIARQLAHSAYEAGLRLRV
jgi:transcriptional regulator NrdR family protein